MTPPTRFSQAYASIPLAIALFSTQCLFAVAIPCGSGGKVTEIGAPAGAIFVLVQTNQSGLPILSTRQQATADDRGNAIFIITGNPQACDVVNMSRIIGHTGEQATLYLEALFPQAGEILIEDLFGRLDAQLGSGVPISIPDLYADTNGDGVLGDGDLLYNLVDINKYLNAVPTFLLGDSFTISGGLVAGLPGMQFSSTPFSYDPISGFVGTPYNGEGVALTLHEIESIPEPSTFFFAAIALACIFNMHRQGREFRGIHRSR